MVLIEKMDAIFKNQSFVRTFVLKNIVMKVSLKRLINETTKRDHEWDTLEKEFVIA